jgi:hypothetical protein
VHFVNGSAQRDQDGLITERSRPDSDLAEQCSYGIRSTP